MATEFKDLSKIDGPQYYQGMGNIIDPIVTKVRNAARNLKVPNGLLDNDEIEARTQELVPSIDSLGRIIKPVTDAWQMNSLRQGLEQHNELLANQKEIQAEKIRQAAGMTETKTITKDGKDGKWTEKTNYKLPDGSTLEHKAVKETPMADMYEQYLQQAMNFKPSVPNMQPLAQLVDTWTGSNFAQGYQDPQAKQQADIANKIKLSGALAAQEQAQEKVAMAAKIKERELGAKELTAKAAMLRAQASMVDAAGGGKNGKTKLLDIVNKLKIGEGKPIENQSFITSLKRENVQPLLAKGLSNAEGLNDQLAKYGARPLPAIFDKYFTRMAQYKTATDLSSVKKAMIMDLMLQQQYKGMTDEDVSKHALQYSDEIDHQMNALSSIFGGM